MSIFARIKRLFSASSGEVKATAKEAAHDVKETFDEVADKVEDAAGKAYHKVRETADPYVEKTKHAAHEAFEKAKDATEDARQKADPYVDKAVDGAKEGFATAASATARKADEWADRLRDRREAKEGADTAPAGETETPKPAPGDASDESDEKPTA